MQYNELINYLSNKELVIYGAGYIAQECWKALKKNNLTKNIQGVCVTEKSNCTDSFFHSFEIVNIDDIVVQDGVLICIATHETMADEIKDVLIKHKIHDYIWMSPEVIFNLNLGNPIKTCYPVNVSELVENINDYGIAIRLLAIDEIENKINFGIDIYKKFICYFSSEEAAEKRIVALAEMYKDWLKSGYDTTSKISIDKNINVIDGCHRISLAYHFRVDYLFANIYDDATALVQERKKAFPQKEELINMGLTQKEIVEVEKKYKKIKIKCMEYKGEGC
ncbi:MAG: hypothetical protein Q4D29_08335 [Lachnospiraceae bacterium]|nr:hypothetical protein [Lachnospiraceae bacterium]